MQRQLTPRFLDNQEAVPIATETSEKRRVVVWCKKNKIQRHE